MNAEQVIKKINSEGGQLALIDGSLKGKNLTDSIRQLVKRYKAEIIYLLLDQIPTEPLLKPCPICHGRYFIHGSRGGYFCTICQPDAKPGKPVKAGVILHNQCTGSITNND